MFSTLCTSNLTYSLVIIDASILLVIGRLAGALLLPLLPLPLFLHNLTSSLSCALLMTWLLRLLMTWLLRVSELLLKGFKLMRFLKLAFVAMCILLISTCESYPQKLSNTITKAMFADS